MQLLNTPQTLTPRVPWFITAPTVRVPSTSLLPLIDPTPGSHTTTSD